MADKTFNWAKQFAKEGSAIFNEQSVKLFRLMQRKYSDQFEFFTQLEKIYKGQHLTSEQKKVTETMELIGSTIDQIDKLLDMRTVPSTEEVDKLFKSTDKLDSNIKFFQGKGIEKVSAALQKRVEEAEKKTGMSFSNLAQSASIMLAKTKTIGRTKKVHPLMAETMKGLGGVGAGIAGAMLGPLGGLATKGIDLYQKNKQEKINVGNKAVAQAVSLESEQSHESVGKMYEHLGYSGKASIPKTIAEKSRTYTEGFGGPKNPFSKTMVGESEVSPEGLGGPRGNVDIGNSLFSFFQNDAYKSKWTVDLMAVLNKIAGVKGGTTVGAVAGGGGFKDMFDKLGSAVGVLGKLSSVLGPVLAVAGAAFVGWKAGRWIGENVKIGGKSVDQHVTDFSKNIMGKSDTAKRKKERKGLRPEQQRAEELMDQGLSPVEASKQAVAEMKSGVGKEKPIDLGKISVVKKAGIKSTETLSVTGGQATTIKSDDVKATPRDKLTPEQLKNRMDLITSEKYRNQMNEVDQLKANVEYKKKGIPINGGVPVLNDLTDEQRKFANEKENELNQRKMDRDNEAMKYQAEMNESLKKIAKGSGTSSQSSSGNHKATNIGDPMVESLSMGSLDVE